MAYDNNHYIPQFILRKYGDKINRYNLATQEFIHKGKPTKAFSERNMYPIWLENMFCKLESRMANLLDKKILNAKDNVILTPNDVCLIKQFFTIATLRVSESFIFTRKHIEPEEILIKMGMIEVKKEESVLDYAYRTMKVILESLDLPSVFRHPEVTYEACKWSMLFGVCDIMIWDSSKAGEDFIITDDGMNCEHDKSRFEVFNFCGDGPYYNEKDEMIKRGYVYNQLREAETKEKENIYQNLINEMLFVHANCYLFAVSGKRTIALINPFFRLYDPVLIKKLECKPNVWPTFLSKEAMATSYLTSQVIHSNKNIPLRYKIKSLTLSDVIIINCNMLDRVYQWIGFPEMKRVQRSLLVYSLIPSRKNYDKLIEKLKELGSEFAINNLQQILESMIEAKYITDEEMKYIEFVYNLFCKKS